MKNINGPIFEAPVEKNDHLLGTAGALLGAIAGAVPWIIVSMNGRFFALLGILIGILARKGHELFGGKPGRQKILTICCAVFFGVILGNVLPDLIEFGQLIYENEIEDATYFDIPFLYFDWIADLDTVKSLFSNLIPCLIFAVMGMSPAFREKAVETKPGTPENGLAENSANHAYKNTIRKKFCRNCGKELPGDAVICEKCGCPVTAKNSQVRNAAAAHDAPSFGFAFLGFVIPLIGLILYLALNSYNPQRAKSCGKGALAGVIVRAAVGIMIGIALLRNITIFTW